MPAASQVPGHRPRARERPFLLVAPDVRAHHVTGEPARRAGRPDPSNGDGDRTTGCSARGSRGGSCGRDRAGQRHGLGVRPRADDQTRRVGDVGRARAGCERNRRADPAETDRTSRPSTGPDPAASAARSSPSMVCQYASRAGWPTQSLKNGTSPTARSSASTSGSPAEPRCSAPDPAARLRPRGCGPPRTARSRARTRRPDRTCRGNRCCRSAPSAPSVPTAAAGSCVGECPLRVAERRSLPTCRGGRRTRAAASATRASRGRRGVRRISG